MRIVLLLQPVVVVLFVDHPICQVEEQGGEDDDDDAEGRVSPLYIRLCELRMTSFINYCIKLR